MNLDTLKTEIQRITNPLSSLGFEIGDIDSVIRQLLNEAINNYTTQHNCTRDTLAYQLTKRSGTDITKGTIDKWTRAKGGWSFPLKYAHHLAAITGDYRLIQLPASFLGLEVLEPRQNLVLKKEKARDLLHTLQEYLRVLDKQLTLHEPKVEVSQ